MGLNETLQLKVFGLSILLLDIGNMLWWIIYWFINERTLGKAFVDGDYDALISSRLRFMESGLCNLT